MKKVFCLLSSVLLLAGCSSTTQYNKIAGNDNFNVNGNLIVSDFPIDGVIDEKDYKDAALTISMGGTADFATKVTAKVVFGNVGMTVGFYSLDKYLSSSTDYSDPNFVVNSDNVEFYIDTLNNKGKHAQSDDYGFLVNPEEFIEMRTGSGSYWSGYSGVVDYAVKVEGTINNDSDIDVGWGCEMFLPYEIFGFNRDSTVGVAFGCRDKNSTEKTSKWTGWTPNPQIIDTFVSLNRNGVVANKVNDLTVNNGGFTYNEGTYTATLNDSLGTFKDAKKSEGTFSVDMYLSFVGENYDNGITIQVNSTNDIFWENSGVDYYFFAITHEGNALLGETSDGNWNEICFAENVNYKLNDWNNLKVVLANNYIACYLNNTYLFAGFIGEVHELPFGLRAAMSGIKYKNIICSDSTEGAYEGIDGFHSVCGDFEYSDSTKQKISAKQISGAGAMIIANEELSVAGAIETNMKVTAGSDNGIVFKVDDGGRNHFWEETQVSYYFFFINFEGKASLGRVLNGSWTDMSGAINIPGYSIEQTYTLRVEYTSSQISCYINNAEMIRVSDSSLVGTQYGFRAGHLGTTFTL